LWKPESYTYDSIPSPIIFKPILSLALPILRKLDQKFTQQIPTIATSCNNVAKEIKEIYHRNSTVIHPPVSVNDYPLATNPGEYYLSVSRLISHKRVDLAVQACTQMKKKLIVVGDGPERKNLEKLAGETIRFVGRVDDEQLKTLYLGSKALLFPSHEDYGIVPLEAQACGRPVIAYGKGGALETVSEGKSGVFFNEQSVDSLIASILDFEKMKFRPHQIRKWVDQFDVKYFISELRNFSELG
jgi:glycosyltransferase involved in cell wall biosynthesis